MSEGLIHLRCSPDVVHQPLEDEVVVLNLRTGIYATVGGSGVTIWEALVGGATVDGLTDELVAGLGGVAVDGEAIAAEIESFVDELRALELVEEVEPVSDRAAPAHPRAGYEPPRLEVFADMQDLLLLDPVHDVDHRGWPHPSG